MVSAYRASFSGDTISFSGGPTFRVKECLDTIPLGQDQAANLLPSIIIVTPDFIGTATELAALAGEDGDEWLDLRWTYSFDTGLEEEAERALAQDLLKQIKEMSSSERAAFGYSFERRNAQREDFYATFGGFFYLGVLLSIVFLFATALIIYYKQISEGYEDQSRFELMQKVGMTKREIRKSVNSQLLTVFFLPLFGAGLHMAFAFPMLQKLLLLFNLDNVNLFALTTGASFFAFACFYLLVYRGTSNIYYKIVSGAGDKSLP